MKKNKQNEEQQAVHRLRKAVDGAEIMRLYATMPTPELARQTGLTVKQIENLAHRENYNEWARKDAVTRSRINSENGKKGGRPRKKTEK